MAGEAVEVAALTKQFGPVRAIDDLSFTVAAGEVTGFLGPNGAGKTTTLRCLLGLVRPTSGSARVGGRAYAELDQPLRHVVRRAAALPTDPRASNSPRRQRRWATPRRLANRPVRSPGGTL